MLLPDLMSERKKASSREPVTVMIMHSNRLAEQRLNALKDGRTWM